MKTRTIHQTISFHASVHDVYEMLMDEKKHARFTGGSARISREPGGTFATNDGYSTGTNKELVQDEKIVQTWRASDWPEDHYSTLTVTLSPVLPGRNSPLSRPEFPMTSTEEISQGWHDYYWNPMKAALKNEK